MITTRLLAPLAVIAAATALSLAALPAAAATATLGHITIVEGSSGTMPFTLTLDSDLEVYGLDAVLTFDGTRIPLDANAPMIAGLSLNGLGTLDGWITNADVLGAVITAAPPSPFVLTAAASYAGVLTFSGLVAGPNALPVSLSLEICDLASCINGNLQPLVITAEGSVTVTAVPEPASWALFAAGLLAVGQLARRRGAAR